MDDTLKMITIKMAQKKLIPKKLQGSICHFSGIKRASELYAQYYFTKMNS